MYSNPRMQQIICVTWVNFYCTCGPEYPELA